MAISIEQLMLASALLVLVSIILGKAIYHRRAQPAREVLHYDPKYLKSASRAREERRASCTEICGLLIEPGEEIEALEGQLDDVGSLSESEDEFKAAIDQMSNFIEPARKLLDEIRLTELEDSDDLRELEEQIEEAEAVIAEAEWMVGNPNDALAQWRLDG